MIADYLKFFDGCEIILDVACGIGNFAELDPARILGIDFTEDELSVAQQRGVRLIKADITNPLPVANEAADGVWCSHVIEHLHPAQVVELLHEISRVTKPGGTVMIRTPTPNRNFWHHIGHIRPYPPKALQEFLLAKGELAIEYLPPPLELKRVIYEFEYPALAYKAYHSLRRAISGNGTPDPVSRLSMAKTASPIASLFRTLARLGIRRTGYTAVLEKNH